MSKHHGASKSRSHRIIKGSWGLWWISWTVDYYYKSSQLRWPRRFRKDTDYTGAVRFAKKHGLLIPEE